MFRSPLVITPPAFSPDEPEAVAALCNRFGCRVHIRKPEADKGVLLDYLRRVTASADPGLLTLHYYTDTSLSAMCGGFHAARLPEIPPDGKILSRPLHTIEELDDAANKSVAYVLLSPIFDSISKTGYRAGFDRATLAGRLRQRRYPFGIVALGGVSAANIGTVCEMGFDGAALLGSLWSGYRNGNDIPALLETYEKTQQTWKRK